MNNDLLQKLKNWRRNIAQKEGAELFRVLPNASLEAIASLKPKTKEELMSVKGIRERKFNKYGIDILALTNENVEVKESNGYEKEDKNEKPYSISNYLNFLNTEFRRYKARIQGEVSSLDIRDNYLFFTLKDKHNESVLSCFMWENNYELTGISLEVGMEIIVDGFPEIYMPSGRFDFKASTIELVGEGALKKAYDELKQKLGKEGLFAPERKKLIPEFPQKIGIITSETGAVIHDFLNNLGKHGYRISFVHSRVEGQVAVRDLLSAIDCFLDKEIDVLVIIRGGGSLESLQAFNNEVLVRKIASLPIPVICGIGHDKDMPLATLVADVSVSTPTAVANVLNESWKKATLILERDEEKILDNYRCILANAQGLVTQTIKIIYEYHNLIFSKYKEIKNKLRISLESFQKTLSNIKINLETSITRSFFSFKALVFNVNKQLELTTKSILGFKVLIFNVNSQLKSTTWFFSKLKILISNINTQLESAVGSVLRFRSSILNINKQIEYDEKIINSHDPGRWLSLGYSIAKCDGKIIKRITDVKVGEEIDIRVVDGTINSTIININNKHD